MSIQAMYERLRPPVPSRIDPSGGDHPRRRPRVLVLGVYMADELNNARAIVSQLAAATAHQVAQRWAALGSSGCSPALQAVTALEVSEPAGKFDLLSRLLERTDVEAYDFLLLCDDDVGLPDAFLDRFLSLQSRLGFALAQPARTRGSYIDHPIVAQEPGILARQTQFVESGPIVSIHRSAYRLILPFDLTSPMGWGYENVWAYRLARAGAKMGIIDATAVEHSLRPPKALYDAEQAYEALLRLHEAHAHLPLEDCYTILEVVAGEAAPLSRSRG